MIPSIKLVAVLAALFVAPVALAAEPLQCSNGKLCHTPLARWCGGDEYREPMRV